MHISQINKNFKKLNKCLCYPIKMASVNNNKAVLEHVTHSMAETALDIYTHRC